jgi:hypothetical protein
VDESPIRFHGVGGESLCAALVAAVWRQKAQRPVRFVHVVGHETAAVFDIAFSPDGKKTALGSADAVVRIYSCQLCGDLDGLVAAARRRVPARAHAPERERFVGS